MKKILSLFAAIGLLLLFFSTSVCYAGAEEESAQIKADVQASVTEFVEAFPSRTPGSEAEKKSAEYLAGKLFGYGLADCHGKTAVSAQSYLQSFSFYVNGVPMYSQNVIGVKKGNGTEHGFVAVGAHYDVASANLTDASGNISAYSYGAFHSGTGVGALLALIEELQNKTLPFDVYFCLFGSRYADLSGSRYFLSTLSEEQKQDMLLYLDLSSLGDGSNLYLYTDEVRRTHEQYLRNVSERVGVTLAETPKDKGISLSSVYYIPYLHDGFACDVLSFMAEDIPVANLFSTAWGKNKKAGGGENPRYLSVQNDTAKALFESGSAVRNMGAAVRLSVAAIGEDSFAEEMARTRKECYRYGGWLNGSLYLVIMVVFVVIGAVACVLLYYRWKPKQSGGEGSGSFEAPFGEEFEAKDRS